MNETSYSKYTGPEKLIEKLQKEQQATPAETLPFTIKADALAGYPFKYWIIFFALLVVAGSILLAVFVQEYAWLILVLLAGFCVAIALKTSLDYKKSLTVTANSIEIRNRKGVTTIPFDKMEPVILGWSYFNNSIARALLIASKELNIRDTISSYNWGKDNVRRFYASIPQQHRDDSSDPRRILDEFLTPRNPKS